MGCSSVCTTRRRAGRLPVKFGARLALRTLTLRCAQRGGGCHPHTLLPLPLSLSQVEFGDRLTLAGSAADPASLNANLLITCGLAPGGGGGGPTPPNSSHKKAYVLSLLTCELARASLAPLPGKGGGGLRVWYILWVLAGAVLPPSPHPSVSCIRCAPVTLPPPS